MTLTGARIAMECLREQQVDTIFGYPGGKVIPLYDALYDCPDICHILTAHEQGASHAADGYARINGKVGVCIATSGPGSTNLITGIATAYMDSSPIVAITGNVGTPWLGKDTFQEVDIIGMTMSVTKHNYQVRRVEDLAGVVREAFEVAVSGRPGPVLIDIPVDVFFAKCEYEPVAGLPRKPVRKQPRPAAVEETLSLIAASRRPMIYAGGGVVRSGATDELIAFAERINAPVACSLMGLGGFPGDHPLFTGLVGMHGSKASNMGVTNCDLLLVVGARFSDRVVGIVDHFAPGARVVHMDIDPAEVNKNIPVVQAVIGDIKMVLQALNERASLPRQTEWMHMIEEWRAEDRACTPEDHIARQIMRCLRELTDEDAIIVTDVGQHQMWTAQYYTFGRRSDLITSGGLGTMGFGLGAAIGAKVGCPARQVVHVAGDGSFRMNLNEMATTARYGIPVKTLLMDNESLGMVRQWQYMFNDRRLSQTILNPVDFCRIAEGFGVRAWRLERPEDIRQVLREALAHEGPALVQCMIDPRTMVLPMVPPNKPIDNIIMKVVE